MSNVVELPKRAADRNPPNYNYRSNCETLCRWIEQYWHARGHLQVRAWPVELTHVARLKVELADGTMMRIERKTPNRWTVASNLVNGLPPRD